MGKHCPLIFTQLFCFSFSRNNACKNAGFPEPALVANVHFADSTVWKYKSFVWKRRRQEKTAVFAYVICGKQKRNQQTKMGRGGGGGWGGCLSSNQKIYLKPFHYKNYEFQYDRRSHNKSKVCAVLRSRVICRNVPLKFIKLSMEKPCLGSSEGHNYGGCILKKTSGI